MLFWFADLLDTDFPLFITLIAGAALALLVGSGFHEACHAYAANSLGDRTPASQGRLTLNPLRHIEPVGAIMMLIIGFGWGKPVQFNPFGLRISPKYASLIVAGAGPLSNLITAIVIAIPIRLGWVPYINPFEFADLARLSRTVDSGEDYAGLFLTTALFLNIILGVFNLIPIPPLDGFKVALAILPDDLAMELQKLDQYGFGLLIALIFLVPFVSGTLGQPIYPLADIMLPPVEFILERLTGID